MGSTLDTMCKRLAEFHKSGFCIQWLWEHLKRKGDPLYHNSSYMTPHFSASSHICFPVYMLPCYAPVGHDWMKQANSLSNTQPKVNLWQEKPDDYMAQQVLPHYNYPNQTKVHPINPEDYYSLS